MELWGKYGDRASFKSKNRYMKRDVKSLPFGSLSAMKLPSPIMKAPLALPTDIRDDEIASSIFDVLDDFIPNVEGVCMNSFRW